MRRKRKQLLNDFKLKESFLNFMLTRSIIFKKIKAGSGYSHEYSERDIFYILVGYELHKLGLAFRYIDSVLAILLSLSFQELK